MWEFFVRSTPPAPFRPLAAASLVGLLCVGLLPAPLDAARGGTAQAEARRRCCRFKRLRRRW